MKGKKHIDELFKEGFKNFEASPKPEVWSNIQAQLAKKDDDRKVIPLWWKLAGVAALIALLVTIGVSVNDKPNDSPSLTTEKQLEKSADKDKIVPEIDANNKQLVSEGNLVEKENSKTPLNSDDNTKFSDKQGNYNSNNQVVSTDDNLRNSPLTSVARTKNNTSKKRVSSNSNSRENVIATTTASEKQKIQKNSEKNLTNEFITNSSEEISQKNKDEAVALENKKTQFITPNYSKENDLQINTDSQKALSANDSEAAKTNLDEKNTSETMISEKQENTKKSIFEAIAEKEVLNKKIAEKVAPENRWVVQPNVAPVYYSSLSNGSSIDQSFNDNSKSSDVNLSYGVQVSYAVNNKLSVRSGISKVDLSYSTGGVEIGSGPIAVAPRGVNYTNGNANAVLFAVDKGALATLSFDGTGGFGNITQKSTQGDAFINQKINYVEVPVELKYALLNNKIGINLIGGLSTLFLGNNEISVSAENFDTVIGEANNLTSISFTTNVGLGVDYKISEKFLFNIEPMFKYQLNPYTDSSVSFKPYYIGIYSGFSFKF